MLVRSDPFRDFGRLTERLLGPPAGMAMDAYRSGHDFFVRFDLPGVAPGDLEVTVERNVLTVSAHRPRTHDDSGDVLVAERPHGTFTRRLFLDESLDTDHIEAAYDRGVLTIRIPVSEEAKPRRVAIASGERPQQLEASTA